MGDGQEDDIDNMDLEMEINSLLEGFGAPPCAPHCAKCEGASTWHTKGKRVGTTPITFPEELLSMETMEAYEFVTATESD